MSIAVAVTSNDPGRTLGGCHRLVAVRGEATVRTGELFCVAFPAETAWAVDLLVLPHLVTALPAKLEIARNARFVAVRAGDRFGHLLFALLAEDRAAIDRFLA